MEDKFKKAFEKVEANYKCFDSTSWLILDTKQKIAELLEIENPNKTQEVQLATAMYMLKALSKLSIVENSINKTN